MDTIIRKLTDGDDLNAVSDLIYETDNCVFPHFFKDSKTSAKEILPHMIQLDTIYNKSNIYVATVEDKIIAIMVLVKSPVQINISAYIEAFDRAGALVDSTFETVMKEYYLPMECQPDGYSIACLCVDAQYRGNGIGGALLDTAMSALDPTLDVYLECPTDNESALAVYKAHGFEPLVKYAGFTGLPYYKMIRRAGRDLD